MIGLQDNNSGFQLKGLEDTDVEGEFLGELRDNKGDKSKGNRNI